MFIWAPWNFPFEMFFRMLSLCCWPSLEYQHQKFLFLWTLGSGISVCLTAEGYWISSIATEVLKRHQKLKLYDATNKILRVWSISAARKNWCRYLPTINFLFPWTISFPARFTKENFNCFPIFTTWLQFSSFLNGNLIGGFDASFQLTDPGDTLSRTSRSTHLHKDAHY